MARAAGLLAIVVALSSGCAYLGTGPDATPSDATPVISAAPTASITAASPVGPTPSSAAPSPSPSSFVYDGLLPLCDDMPLVAAPADWYRDSPIYVGNEMPVLEVRDWAQTRPGYQEIWIDREKNGWITVAFNSDAAARQAELKQQFPGVGVVAVQVDWTGAELEALQRRVIDELAPRDLARGSGQYRQEGVVSIGIGPLSADRVAAVEAVFAGERVCLEGFDPNLLPSPGPQRLSGDGWRLLADEDERGHSYRTGIAYDEDSYAALWRQAGLTGDRPPANFESEVAIWFGAVHGSSCPNLRLDDVVVDQAAGLVHAQIVTIDSWGACTDDAIPHAYVVALERAMLPHGPFVIQLDAAGPPAGAPEERTVVRIDLSAPGSVAGPGDITADPDLPEPGYIEPGGIVEPGYPFLYRQSAECGLEWLGPINSVAWRTDVPAGSAEFIPPEWHDAVDEGHIVLEIVIEEGQPPTLSASTSGHTIVYEASPVGAPACN